MTLAAAGITVLRFGMAMTLRLSDAEVALLREQAEREHRSMHEVVRLAVLERIDRTRRSEEIREIATSVIERDAELMHRLAQ